MSKPMIPPVFQRNDAVELFRVLHSLAAFAKGRSEYDPEVGETAAMILLSRLGLAAPLPYPDDEEGTWVLTVEGNERLAELLVELRQWDPESTLKRARRRRMKRQADSENIEE